MNTLNKNVGAFGWGPTAFLANGVLLYVILAWLARSSADAFERTFLLAAGNLGVACVLLMPQLRCGALLLSRRTSAALLGWSFAYSIIYGTFVIFPERIPVWGLVTAQACAPLVALFVSGDYRRDTASLNPRFVQSLPIVFLLAVAFLEWRTSNHPAISSMFSLALVLLFAFSQSCARIVARCAPSPFWAPPRLAFLNATLLFTFWTVFGRSEVPSSGLVILRHAVLLSVGIFSLQALYLFALAKTAPFLSALLLSACVPISIVGDSLLKNGPSHPVVSLWLTVGFTLTTGVVTWAVRQKPGVQPRVLAQDAKLVRH